MKTLHQLCTPRPTVFDRSKRDVPLDLTDLVDHRIDADEFFAENYVTAGMQRLLTQAFRRFRGETEQGVYVLTQAMGGGKTHNMIALGLLAQHTHLRQQVLEEQPVNDALGTVRVVAFTGRESDAPFGIWGAIAEQLGKKDSFNAYYSPLSAPGQTAWVNLLQGEPLLILLDELPPYFDNARSREIGNSDLAQVTTTALANMLVALGKQELTNVCVVISDLRATYEGGSEQLSRALENLKHEVKRGAVSLEPVAMNTDEVYHILRTRLFAALPSQDEILPIAQAYAKSVADARQMDITNASPQTFVQQICDSYPFHFAIRDLYARFRENPGFQQTRGLIRLMRVLVSRLFDPQTGSSDSLYLIHAHNLDLNDRETLAEVTEINPRLGNAISHDIASEGDSIAEEIDLQRGETDAQDVCKLLLVASLANVPGALLGLSMSETISLLCAPGRDISRVPREVIDPLLTRAWYLHTNQEGKLFFKDVQNLVAKLKATAESYTRESSHKELRTFLKETFTPTTRDCYQEVLALQPIDAINPGQERVVLVIAEPYPGGGLAPALKQRFSELDYKNRVLFLSGNRSSLDTLLEIAAEYKAIEAIIKEMNAEKVREDDPQYLSACDISEKVRLRLMSTVRETFTTLYYPASGDQLMSADFLMNFTANEYNGEMQIRGTLLGKQKFTEDVSGDIFRKKCEQRLFTQKVMLWSEVLRRAATNTIWQWHHPNALNALRDALLSQEQWRQQGTMIERGPFPPPHTEVRYRQLSRDDDTGEAILELTAVHGDTIYYEIGAPATTASEQVPDPRQFRTDALEVSFLCVDSSGTHETGEPCTWKNSITLKGLLYQDGDQRRFEIRASPPAPVKYSTDGSDPRTVGGLYEEPIITPDSSRVILAIAEKDGIASETFRYEVPQEHEQEKVDVPPHAPVRWKRHHEPKTTRESYELLERMRKHQAQATGPRITVTGKTWVEFSCDDEVALEADQLDGLITDLRGLISEGEVALEIPTLRFAVGQHLLDWVADVKTELRPNEVMY
jgi:hypothetical protein